MNQDMDVELDTMNTVDSWHFNKAQMNRKNNINPCTVEHIL